MSDKSKSTVQPPTIEKDGSITYHDGREDWERPMSDKEFVEAPESEEKKE